MWLVIVWILILSFNVLYSLFSPRFQEKKYNKLLRKCAVIVALVILTRGIVQEVSTYRSQAYAYIASDGTILERTNFPWDIRRYPSDERKSTYILAKRSDGTELSVRSQDCASDPNVYGCSDGVCIEFDCPQAELERFEIRVKD